MQKIIAKYALTQGGWKANVEISIENGRIAVIRPVSANVLPTVGLALPAPMNLHSHSFQRAMSGLTEGRGPSRATVFGHGEG